MREMVKEEINHYLDEHINEEIDRTELEKIVQKAIFKMLVEIRREDNTDKET